jgi:hypothetical protein
MTRTVHAPRVAGPSTTRTTPDPPPGWAPHPATPRLFPTHQRSLDTRNEAATPRSPTPNELPGRRRRRRRALAPPRAESHAASASIPPSESPDLSPPIRPATALAGSALADLVRSRPRKTRYPGPKPRHLGRHPCDHLNECGAFLRSSTEGRAIGRQAGECSSGSESQDRRVGTCARDRAPCASARTPSLRRHCAKADAMRRPCGPNACVRAGTTCAQLQRRRRLTRQQQPRPGRAAGCSPRSAAARRAHLINAARWCAKGPGVPASALWTPAVWARCARPPCQCEMEHLSRAN